MSEARAARHPRPPPRPVALRPPPRCADERELSFFARDALAAARAIRTPRGRGLTEISEQMPLSRRATLAVVVVVMLLVVVMMLLVVVVVVARDLRADAAPPVLALHVKVAVAAVVVLVVPTHTPIRPPTP